MQSADSGVCYFRVNAFTCISNSLDIIFRYSFIYCAYTGQYNHMDQKSNKYDALSKVYARISQRSRDISICSTSEVAHQIQFTLSEIEKER